MERQELLTEKDGSGNEYLDFKFANLNVEREEQKRLHNDEDKIVQC